MACRGCSSSDGCGCSVVGSADDVITFAGSGAPVTGPYTPTFHGDTWLESLTDLSATACESLNAPQVPILLGDGSVGIYDLPCANTSGGHFGGNAFAFTYSTTTTDADPGDGFLRLNNATPSSVTQIYVDLEDTGGSTITAWLDSLDDSAGSPKGRIRLYSESDPTNWIDFKLTAVTTATGYRKLVVTYNASGGTLLTTIGDTVLDFVPSSDGSVGGFDSIQDIETVTTTYQLDILDVGKYLRSSSASGFNITVPANATVAFTIGSRIEGIQAAAGQITFVAAGGVTINATPGLKTNGQWASWALIKVGTNEWDLTGNLTS